MKYCLNPISVDTFIFSSFFLFFFSLKKNFTLLRICIWISLISFRHFHCISLSKQTIMKGEISPKLDASAYVIQQIRPGAPTLQADTQNIISASKSSLQVRCQLYLYVHVHDSALAATAAVTPCSPTCPSRP